MADGKKKIMQLIEKLKDVKSNERSLLTLVISPREEIPHAITRIGELTANNKSEFYKYAEEAITSAQEILGEYNKIPDNGLIIYTGTVYTDDGPEDFKIEIEPSKCPSNWILPTFDITQITELLTVNPQSFAYFSFLSAVGGIITFQLAAVRLVLRQNPSLFKDHGGAFTIMIIVSGSMAVLSSSVLVLSSFLLKNWMEEIHYTILKTIGSFSAILVPFSLGAALFFPSGDLNWIAYTVLFVIFGGLLYLYSFIWKVACAYQQEKHFNSYPVHWAYLLIILVPLTISLLSFFSSSLRWLAGVFVVAFLLYCLRLLLSVIAFMSQQRRRYCLPEVQQKRQR